jgi:hypothetical protein
MAVIETEASVPVQFDTKDPSTHYVNWETVRVPLCPDSETAREKEEMFLTAEDIAMLRVAMQDRGLHLSSKSPRLSALHDLLGLMGQWLAQKKEGN